MKRTPKTFLLRKLGVLSSFVLCVAASQDQSNTSVFSSVSTPAHSITRLGYLVLAITGGLFLAISGLLVYAIIRYRAGPHDEEVEPPQVFGSTEIELSWTIIPVLIIVVLFLTTAGVIFGLQDKEKPRNALEVTVVGHQFWWEFRYPQLGVTTANELHIPVSNPQHPWPSFLKLTSADVDHSFWVPQLAGKVDLLPNRVNELWTDPHQPGLYVGQCTMLCGVEHAKMLLRVYVDTPEQFQTWIKGQQLAQISGAAAEGRRIFETNSCINCHTVAGTRATGRFGPDLTHLMTRATIASGSLKNDADNLKKWVENPDQFKPGVLMPSMHLSKPDLEQITVYLTSLK